jgi:hypothetical protein
MQKCWSFYGVLLLVVAVLASDFGGIGGGFHGIEDVEFFQDRPTTKQNENHIVLYLMPKFKNDLEKTTKLAKNIQNIMNADYQGTTAKAVSSVCQNLISILT